MKILIIDDEEFLMENLAQYLEKKIPAQISCGSRAEQALQRLENNKFDLVICDLNLHDQSEGELVLSINKLKPHQPFIIISALSENEMPKCLRENKNLNIVAYFEKPFNIVSIKNEILAIKKLQLKNSIEA